MVFKQLLILATVVLYYNSMPQLIIIEYLTNINKYQLLTTIYLYWLFKIMFIISNLLGVQGFLHTSAMATVVMCRVRNPACTATSTLWKERYING